MSDQHTRLEISFAAKIDCRFPYLNLAEASALIKEGWMLSSEAAFGVLSEICRKPASAKVSRQRRHELIEE